MKYIIALVAAFALMAGIYFFGSHVENLKRVAQISQLNAAHEVALADANKAAADAQQKARDIEAQRAIDMAALDDKYQKELSDAKANADSTLAAYKSNTLQLRGRLTCARTSSVPLATAPSTSASSVDAASASGLQSADVEFLVRDAERADQYAKQVKALQDVVSRDRAGVVPGASK
jgi:hypothetical protein